MSTFLKIKIIRTIGLGNNNMEYTDGERVFVIRFLFFGREKQISNNFRTTIFLGMHVDKLKIITEE